MKAKFGVAGNSYSFFAEGHVTTAEAAVWCAERGVDVFEYSFGRGVTLSVETASVIGDAFEAAGVELSAHAPYFINFANVDTSMIEKSIGYVLSTIKRLKAFGGNRVVVHPASQGKLSREEAVAVTGTNLALLNDALKINDIMGYKICLETMGKHGQIGNVDEIIEFCSLSDSFYPCMDFGHINAREGGILKTSNDYENIIVKMLDGLKAEKVKNMHVHFSKIQYGAKGELRHLTFADNIYGPEFEPLAEIFHKYDLTPYVICESDGTQAEDALYMKNYFFGT